MFCSRKLKNLINKVHERYLRTGANDKLSGFKMLLSNNSEIKTHQRNMQILMVEVYKIMNSYTPPIMNNLVVLREKTDIRNFHKTLNENKKNMG